MPVITRIQTDNHHKGFYKMEVARAGGQILSLTIHEAILVHHELRKDLELSEDQLKEVQKEAGHIDAYLAAIRYLSFRMRSKYELRHYLEKKGYRPDQIQATLERLVNEKLLDDRAFAAAFVTSRIKMSTKGPKLIYRELLQAGVDQEIAEAAEDLYPEAIQMEHARTYLQKKLTSVKNKKSFAEATRVLSRLLMQRGYSREITVHVISEIGEFLEESSVAALNDQGEKAIRKFKKYNGSDLVQRVKTFLYRKGFTTDEIMSFLHNDPDVDD